MRLVQVMPSGLVRFQSAPGREAGRCPADWPAGTRPNWFQSAPGREAGRCPYHLANASLLFMFQSAPGREAGRCMRPGRCG
ncbi:MAG: hypothetical protein FD142_1194 [bacterium]|nr:MAG: hypothetical protein FD142_1194 [bacterium]